MWGVLNQGYRRNSTSHITHLSLDDMAMRILDWCLEHQSQLQARHIPGSLRARAEFISHQGPLQTEWMLNPSIFWRINAFWRTPEIDLMATRQCSKEAFCVSSNRRGWLSTQGVGTYTCVPQHLWSRIYLVQPNTLDTIIVSKWENQPWLPDLLHLMIDHPLQLRP